MANEITAAALGRSEPGNAEEIVMPEKVTAAARNQVSRQIRPAPIDRGGPGVELESPARESLSENFNREIETWAGRMLTADRWGLSHSVYLPNPIS